MTIEIARHLDRDYVTVREAAEIIGCAPQRLRDALDIDDDRPVDRRRFLFPHCKVGNRRRIMREGFLKWAVGAELKPDLPCADSLSVGYMPEETKLLMQLRGVMQD